GNERLIGVYENVPGATDGLLAITDLGVYCWTGERWRNLKYAEIAATEWPAEEKTEARTLVIRKNTGAREAFPILGGSEVGREIFTFMRFFDRVAADIRRAA